MSVEGQVLGCSTVAGGCGGAVSQLANTGSPVIVGFAVGLAVLVALGFITRAAQNR
jgi:LPXTG-motif cell wall-anchored protein